MNKPNVNADMSLFLHKDDILMGASSKAPEMHKQPLNRDRVHHTSDFQTSCFIPVSGLYKILL